MGKLITLVTRAGLVLLLGISALLIAELRDWGQAPDLAVPTGITAEQAKAFEAMLDAKPDDLATREALISYYFRAALTSRDSALEEKHEQHVFWLIEHHPESELAGSPEAGILAMGFSQSTEGYQHGKQLWLQQTTIHAGDPDILRHAAEFLLLQDGKIARDLLEKALAVDPGDPESASMLAHSYEQELALTTSPEEKLALAQKAVTVRERGLEKADPQQTFYGLASLAVSALEAGETAKAQQYAAELLQSAEKFKSNWNYGNAVHKGNIVLGRIALGRGDLEGAKEHLLAAGQTPGSPQLDSFGPNMTLAKELLEKGEREAVLTYLQSCGKFWKMDRGSLQDWTATIKGGGTPDFGANLDY